MSINSIIINALKTLGVPVSFQNYKGSATTYIRFFEYNQNGALHGDDQELKSAHFIQVDIFSKGDYTELTNQVKQKLKEIGFIRTMETEMYERDTDFFHKVIRFNFVQ
ncbi:hypothetical protein J7E79_02705 [Bacillus sp. ISL-40]|uniref:hypothetical protein n=1 Tax=unclassified Bacillus (in: firmicutes) TaxID=185979 RepID=UPI001BE91537|nr:MULTISPECIES: hypothetical protein [unclassified Bacillus (in: firmicutes)]MBT2696346.1 hypothetical protein [Bacillus sp. ISL-40]MBT2743195.1 hypothetical protein [Bacillus sp. ISL-77]